jgi:hypothetical protein
MARHSTPERIYQAKRAGTIERLATNAGYGRADAEAWLEAWEREAEAQGLPRTDPNYWDAGSTWIASNRALRRRPGAVG